MIKTPYERAKEVYLKEPCARSFEEDLEAHMMFGFVFSRPDYFVMGRPVNRFAMPEEIVNPYVHFKTDEQNCWHVYLMAGNIARAWDILPWELPIISFERGNILRFYELERLKLSTANYNANLESIS